VTQPLPELVPEPLPELVPEPVPEAQVWLASLSLFKGTSNTAEESPPIPLARVWPWFFKRFLAPDKVPLTDKPKETLPAFAPATYRNRHRLSANAIILCAIVLDYDNEVQKVPLPLERRTTLAQGLAAFDGITRFAYSSPSHTDELHKFRLILVPDRTMRVDEWRVVQAHVYRLAREAGHTLDEKVRDAGRLWFYGARRNDHYEASWVDGAPLDVDKILNDADVQARLTQDEDPEVAQDEQANAGRAPQANVDTDRGVGHGERMSRATSLIRRWEPKVNKDGSGDLFHIAHVLVRGYVLPPDDALRLLREFYCPKVKTPWTDDQLQARITDVAKETKPPTGWRLGRYNPNSATMFASDTPTDASEKTDWGNAQRLAAHVRDTVRFVPEWNAFVRWSGKCWERDAKGHLVMHDFSKLTETWIANSMAIEDAAQRATAVRWALTSQASARIEAATKHLKTIPEMRLSSRQFDANHLILNTQSGVLKLGVIDGAGVEQVPHDSKFMCTKITACGYNPQATCPTWDRFLISSATDASGKHDPELMAYRRRRRGSYLSGFPDKILELSFDNFAEEQEKDDDSAPTGAKGNSGKTTYYSTICTKVLGTYSDKVDRRCFEKQRSDQHPTHLAELEGLRFAYGAEISHALDIEQIKDLTGERSIKARKMQQDMHSFERLYKLAAYANSPPKIRKGEDDPIWNRVLADCWHAKIEKPLPEGHIDNIYTREAEGILADMVRGWVEYLKLRMNLAPPESIKLATRNYQSHESPLADFIEVTCDIGPEYTMSYGQLWELRQIYTKGNKYLSSETTQQFQALLTSCGYPSIKKGKLGDRYRKGLRKKPDKHSIGVEDVGDPQPDQAETALLGV
jgi:phage/plasmid-associated DNA primase